MTTALYNLVRWRGLLAITAIFIAIAAISQASVSRAVLGKAGLVKPPAGYTSLAFLDPQSLPEQLSSRQSTLAVSFVIRNAGGAARDYRWSVLLAQGARTRRIDAGQVGVRSGHEVPLTRSEKISCRGGTRMRIIVNLASPAEAIGAWAKCQSPKR